MNHCISSVIGSAIAGLVFSANPAFAQGTRGAYPDKPIRIIVAYTPAGATDILARAVGQKMSEAWGQPVIVENRPGANGNIGTEVAARATPDGYTLLMVTAGSHGVNPSLYRKLTWDAVKDFTPISLVAMVPNIMVVNTNVPVKTVKELVAYLKASPGKFSYGSPGLGSTAHMSMELFKSMTGTDIVHIPYKGSGPAMTDLLGGHVPLMMDSTSAALTHIVDGRIRALAVTTARPAPAPLDKIPTIAQTVPGFNAAGWSGLAAPARTPLEIVAKVNRDVQALLNDPAVIRQIEQRAAIPAPGSPLEFAEFIKKEIDTWGDVVRATGTKPGT